MLAALPVSEPVSSKSKAAPVRAAEGQEAASVQLNRRAAAPVSRGAQNNEISAMPATMSRPPAMRPKLRLCCSMPNRPN